MSALTAWARDGVPERPGAWLTTAARRTALNALARGKTLEAKLPLLLEPEARTAWTTTSIPDDRLRLVFTCCHPALAREAQVALTLRLVCGVTTTEIAHAFLVSEPTMAARLTRAKKKIAAAGIPYVGAGRPRRRGWTRCWPSCTCWPRPATPRRRASSWRAPTWPSARSTSPACCACCCPGEREVAGLLALLLLLRARAATRDDVLEEQDRSRWDRALIAEADALIVGGADRPGRPGASRCRPRSPACTPRRRPTPRPTGRSSSCSTTCCCASGPRRSSRSIAPWSSPRCAGRRRAWPRSRRSRASTPTATSGRPGPTSCAASAATRRRARPTARPCASPTTPPNARSSKLKGSDPFKECAHAGGVEAARDRVLDGGGGGRDALAHRLDEAEAAFERGGEGRGEHVARADRVDDARPRGASIQTGSWSHTTAAPAAAAVTTAASAPRRTSSSAARSARGRASGAASTASSARPCSTPSASPRFGTTTSGYACSAAASAGPAASTTDRRPASRARATSFA